MQHQRDVALLDQLRTFFGCGQVTVNNGDRMEFRIRGLKELSERVVPFFRSNPLRTVKRSSFECFAEVIAMLQAITSRWEGWLGSESWLVR